MRAARRHRPGRLPGTRTFWVLLTLGGVVALLGPVVLGFGGTLPGPSSPIALLPVRPSVEWPPLISSGPRGHPQVTLVEAIEPALSPVASIATTTGPTRTALAVPSPAPSPAPNSGHPPAKAASISKGKGKGKANAKGHGKAIGKTRMIAAKGRAKPPRVHVDAHVVRTTSMPAPRHTAKHSVAHSEHRMKHVTGKHSASGGSSPKAG